jgi:hypothetical protein
MAGMTMTALAATTGMTITAVAAMAAMTMTAATVKTMMGSHRPGGDDHVLGNWHDSDNPAFLLTALTVKIRDRKTSISQLFCPLI